MNDMRPLDAWLRAQPGRCPDCGVHLEKQAPLHVGGCLPSGEAGKAEGMARALAASPDQRSKVEAAILHLAKTGRPFSSNDAREIHGVIGPVVGATFQAVARAGLIRKVGFESSTAVSTHGHPVAQWIGVAA